MTRAQMKRWARGAYAEVSAEIHDNARMGDIFARGLAAEGYAGGYRDALSDCLMLLNGQHPQDIRGYWRASLAKIVSKARSRQHQGNTET